ncbi:hypothetical protein [Rhizobium leguminosarum]|uniref:hypothetical protein n=1 Tax=Rhizobium leguminosarum TaxID=384 RepID=UPI001FEDE38B|nr:hypothetical protein [Rhizobium leguminosarum]
MDINPIDHSAALVGFEIDLRGERRPIDQARLRASESRFCIGENYRGIAPLFPIKSDLVYQLNSSAVGANVGVRRVIKAILLAETGWAQRCPSSFSFLPP